MLKQRGNLLLGWFALGLKPKRLVSGSFGKCIALPVGTCYMRPIVKLNQGEDIEVTVTYDKIGYLSVKLRPHGPAGVAGESAIIRDECRERNLRKDVVPWERPLQSAEKLCFIAGEQRFALYVSQPMSAAPPIQKSETGDDDRR